jgi:formimidoylglutamate deiminase
MSERGCVGAARLGRRALAARRAAARRTPRPLVAASRPARPAPPQGAEVLPRPVLPGWSTRTATPSSAPSPAWPSGATAPARRLLVLARPHVRRGAAHHARAAARGGRPAVRRAAAGGYTQVCEFHYLQHAPTGALCRPGRDGLGAGRRRGRRRHRPDAAAGAVRARRLRRQPRPARRPAPLCTTAARCWRCSARLRGAPRPLLTAAWRSTRCARHARRRCARWPSGGDGPLHIHVAEQRPRCDDCLAPPAAGRSSGCCATPHLDARWQLVHATHSAAGEIDAVAARGAGVVLCPGTEANLGDGLTDLPRWLASGRAAVAGLRQPGHARAGPRSCAGWSTASAWCAASATWPPPGRQPATAARLFERMRAGRCAAAGLARWGLQPAPAPTCWCSTTRTTRCSACPAQRLDALVFAGPRRPFGRVMVAGRWADRVGDAAELAPGSGPTAAPHR